MWNLRRFVPIRSYLIGRGVNKQKKSAPLAQASQPQPVSQVFDESKNETRSDLKTAINVGSDLKIAVEQLPQSLEFRKAASYDDIPGPKWLKSVAKMWTYLPVLENHLTTRTLQYVLSADQKFGNQLSWGNNLMLFRYLLNEYGPIVRLHGPFGGDIVIISRPEHAAIVLKNDGPHPVRSTLDCLEKYRLEYRKYRNAGPFVMHGPEWEVMRNNIEHAMQESLRDNSHWLNNVAAEFMGRLKVIRNRQQEVPDNFLGEIQKWSIECLCGVMFNKSFGFLNTRGYSEQSDNAILLTALNEATAAIKKCEFGFHLWKLWQTPSWKKLVAHCDTIDNILATHLRKRQEILRERKDKLNYLTSQDVSMIDYLLLKESLSGEDILTILLDMLIFGVNMTAYSAGFILYHLAKNPREQHKLYEEVKNLPADLNNEHVKELTFLKACLHESLRLKPPMPVLSRILNNDVTIYGYKVPKGTFVLIATNLSSIREEHFEEALKFRPGRWLNWDDKEVDKEAAINLATIPFGYGPKACFAKELAEVQISHLIIKIIQKYRVEYHYGDIDSNNKLLSSPNRPLKLRFVDRERE